MQDISACRRIDWWRWVALPLLLVLVLIGAMGLGTVHAASEVVDQAQETVDIVVSSNYFAQTVTVGKTGLMSHIDLVTGCSTGHDANIEIRTVDTNGAPTNTVLGTGVAHVNDQFYAPVTLSPTVRVTEGMQFAIVIPVGTDFCWGGAFHDVYAGGRSFGGFTDVVPDLGFRTYIQVPDTTITARPSERTNSTNASFSFTSSEADSTFQCSLNDAVFTACTSPQSYSGLADGAHTFQARAIDAAGTTDPSPASFEWKIDTVAPDTTVMPHLSNPSSSPIATFDLTGTDDSGMTVSFECSLDDAAFIACTTPKRYTGLSNGSHTFQARAIDFAGNVDATPDSYTWTISVPTATPTNTSVPPTSTPTNTPLPPTATATATSTATATATSTNTPVPPTATATATVAATATDTPMPPTATATATNTATATATGTNTTVPPTATATATATSTTTPVLPTATATATMTPLPTSTTTSTPVLPTATRTSTPLPTSTSTSVPPTTTRTAIATTTATSTSTPVPPTVTATATNTPLPTSTSTPVPPTAISTNTPVPLTATATATAISTNTPVPPTATRTATATPTKTSTPMLPTSTPVPPTTGILDTFNRANGSVGANWEGLAGTNFYKLTSNQLDVELGGPLLWKPSTFDTSQEAFVTLTTIDPKSRSQGVLLKVQTSSIPNAGAISVTYEAVAKAVRVSTVRLGTNGAWTLYKATAATFANGDVLKARALASGDVQIYKNGTLLTTVTLNAADKNFFNAKDGKIGIWTGLAPKAVLDDFGGSTIAASSTAHALDASDALDQTPQYQVLLPTVRR